MRRPARRSFLLISCVLLSLSACDNARLFDALRDGVGSAAASQTSAAEESGGIWTWVGGSDDVGESPSYGVVGVTRASNHPGARERASTWTDDAGNLWLFGGLGVGNPGANPRYNDLWRFDGAAWTWEAGASLGDVNGTYGRMGVPADDNAPGSRNAAVSWTTPAGDLWLFGGLGFDRSASRAGLLNDLWRFSGDDWTWVSGDPRINQVGNYRPRRWPLTGVDVKPGARSGATTWTSADGDLWLFGGEGYAAERRIGLLNDLWKFDGNDWRWINGASAIDPEGAYSTPGQRGQPGSRRDAVGWTDTSGNFWLFGGYGVTPQGEGYLNDLWQYDETNGWIWIAGTAEVDQRGHYGTSGRKPFPGARASAVGVTGQDGRLWLFGGHGRDRDGSEGALNDLWVFDGSDWTWVAGSPTVDSPATFGTKGVAAETNVPGARSHSAAWIDPNGSIWLFGGNGITDDGSQGRLNDLWRFDP